MTRNVLPLPILVSLTVACAQDLDVHIRGGDRPPDPGYLVMGLAVDGGVTVDRFQVVMRNMRLQSQPTDGGVVTPGNVYVGPGPFLIDLSGPQLTGGTFTPLVNDYAVGAKGFYEMDIDLLPVSQGDVALNPSLQPMLGNTFVIHGTNQQGAQFTFQSSMATVLIRESVFRMGMNHNNIDVNIAPNAWFLHPDGGAPLDPASTDPAVRALIESNVATSIDAYEDDDMNGIPDPLG
jgi:hypothetical protein